MTQSLGVQVETLVDTRTNAYDAFDEQYEKYELRAIDHTVTYTPEKTPTLVALAHDGVGGRAHEGSVLTLTSNKVAPCSHARALAVTRGLTWRSIARA